MSIGLKRGTVVLEDHQPEWEQNARETIGQLREALRGIDADFRHVGSTSIRSIKAKPIIDIAVAVRDMDEVIGRNDELLRYGVIFRADERPEHLLYVKGDFNADTRTHHIHVVLKGSKEWNDYLNFSDYLNANRQAAAEYEAVKIMLAERYPADRNTYTEEKGVTVTEILAEAEKWRKEDPRG